jgi:undecaprenyl-diphosphatase
MNLKTARYILTLALPLTIFIFLTVNVLNNGIQTFDTFVYSRVSKIISEKMTSIMVFITFLASGKFLSLVSILLLPLFFINKRKYSLYAALIIINVSLSSLLNIGLKTIINRARPDILKLVEVSGLSFPSGHSMASMSFYGFLIYLCNRNIKSKYRYAVTVFLVVLIFLIGFSRIYLGVHYASDVVGGFSMGLFWIGLFTLIIDKVQENHV